MFLPTKFMEMLVELSRSLVWCSHPRSLLRKKDNEEMIISFCSVAALRSGSASVMGSERKTLPFLSQHPFDVVTRKSQFIFIHTK